MVFWTMSTSSDKEVPLRSSLVLFYGSDTVAVFALKRIQDNSNAMFL